MSDDLVERLNDPHRRLVVSDRQEAAAVIGRLSAALLLARRAILRESAEDEQIALSDIDTILGEIAGPLTTQSQP